MQTSELLLLVCALLLAYTAYWRLYPYEPPEFLGPVSLDNDPLMTITHVPLAGWSSQWRLPRRMRLLHAM